MGSSDIGPNPRRGDALLANGRAETAGHLSVKVLFASGGAPKAAGTGKFVAIVGEVYVVVAPGHGCSSLHLVGHPTRRSRRVHTRDASGKRSFVSLSALRPIPNTGPPG
jgi:hypothetical protein